MNIIADEELPTGTRQIGYADGDVVKGGSVCDVKTAM